MHLDAFLVSIGSFTYRGSLLLERCQTLTHPRTTSNISEFNKAAMLEVYKQRADSKVNVGIYKLKNPLQRSIADRVFRNTGPDRGTLQQHSIPPTWWRKRHDDTVT